MEVTHHKCQKQFRKYVVEAEWDDCEQEAHIGRTFGQNSMQFFVGILT